MKLIPFEVNIVHDRSFLISHKAEIEKMIDDAYAPQGGYVGRPLSKISPFDNIDLSKVVVNSQNKIIAIALYSTSLGGVKRFCSAGIRNNKESLEAVEKIIKDDIVPYNNWYWVEASGTIEKLFKKFGGNPIPNYFAHKFLQKPNKDFKLNPDGIHYKRNLKPLIFNSDVEKVIFGFKDKARYDKVMKSVENYEDFKNDVNQAVEDILDEDEKTGLMKELIGAIYVIQILEEWQDFGNLNELTPKMFRELKSAKTILEQLEIEKSLSQENRNLARFNLRISNLLLKSMPVLKLRQFHLK